MSTSNKSLPDYERGWADCERVSQSSVDAAIARAERAEKRCERLRAALVEIDRRLANVWNSVDGMMRLATNTLHVDDDEAPNG